MATVNTYGNILPVISDKPIPHQNGQTVDYWLAEVRQATDYSPFGVQLQTRNLFLTVLGNVPYRYSFQGQEHDDEIKGEGNSVNFEFRMHDPRIGRFFAIDPLTSKYPWYTPYQFSGNKLISFRELEGLEEHTATTNTGQELTLSGPYNPTFIEGWAESNSAYITHSDHPDVKTNVTFFASGAGHDRDNTGYIDATINDLRLSGISNPTDVNAHYTNMEDVKFSNGVFSTTPYDKTHNPEDIDGRILDAADQIESYLSQNNVNQINLFGYSAGSVIFAQAALYLSNEKDIKIDNLILLGTTIGDNSELMDALLSNPNIGSVWTVDIIGDNVKDGAGAALSFIREGDSHPHFKFAFWSDAHERRMDLFKQFINKVGVR